VRDLLTQSELDQLGGLQRLCRLLAVGLICREEERPENDAALLLTSGILAKFSDRIEKSIQREPPGMSAEEHRQLIAGLLARLGGMTYYELLGIQTTATSEEVHDAYTRVARVVHPSNASNLGLSGREAGMGLLFEKATEAYLTLIDDEKSMRYLQKVGSVGGIVESHRDDSRRVEMERVAEENFRRAEALFAREEYHFAIELLQQAVRIAAKSEYLVLLARCQAQNPKWIDRAISSFQRALEIDSTNGDARLELAQILEAAGESARAEEAYREVLQDSPDSVGASSALARLSARKRRSGASRQSGVVARILSRWRPDRRG
jgi:tetratricopeptide (TPR) repeat protein